MANRLCSMQQENLNNARRDLQEAENNLRTRETGLTRAKQAKVRYDRETTSIRQQRQRCEDEIERLQGELDADAANDTGALDELHAQYNEAEQNLQAANDTMMDSINALDKSGQENSLIKQQLDAATREVEEAQARLTKAQKRLEDKETQRVLALRKKNEALEMVESAQREKATLEESRTEQEGTVNAYLEEANKVCRRIIVDPGMTVDALDAKLEKLEKDHQRYQARHVSTAQNPEPQLT
jgi:DNA repair exonuclease SbcCD ATPase subunit